MINIGDKISESNPFTRNSLQSFSGNIAARNRFIKRVYSIIMAQLAVTIAMVLLTMLSQSFAKFQMENSGLYFLAAFVSFGTLTVMGCVDGMSTKSPQNIILLCVFTLAKAYTVSWLCALYTTESVITAAIATLGAVLGLTLYAVKTKTDFSDNYSKCYGFLWSFFFIAIFLVVMNIFFIQCQGLSLLIATAFAALFSLYLIIDTQLIMGGRRKEFRTDQYVMGAVMMYTNIVVLFKMLLKLLGDVNWRRFQPL